MNCFSKGLQNIQDAISFLNNFDVELSVETEDLEKRQAAAAEEEKKKRKDQEGEGGCCENQKNSALEFLDSSSWRMKVMKALFIYSIS